MEYQKTINLLDNTSNQPSKKLDLKNLKNLEQKTGLK